MGLDATQLNDVFNIGISGVKAYTLIRPKNTYSNPYIAIYSNSSYELLELVLFESYTKGIDQFDSATFKYSGRDLFSTYTPDDHIGYFSAAAPYTDTSLRALILFEDDIMPGDTYGYKRYFIQPPYYNKTQHKG